MNRIDLVRSLGASARVLIRRLVTSMAEKSSVRRSATCDHQVVSLCSRIHVESLLRHAL